MHRAGSRTGMGFQSVVAVALCLLAARAPAGAAEPELVTDRPDQTESSKVVGRGRVQLESGWSFARDDEGGVRTETSEVGNSLARIGLDGRFELRLGWAGYVSQAVETAAPVPDADGLGDTSVGFKLYMGEERGRRPELALLIDSSLPTGSDDVSSERSEPRLRLSGSHTLSERIGLGYNAGLAWEAEDGRHTLSSYVYTAALGFAVSERTGAFAEVFGSIPASASGGPAHSLDGGVTYLLRDNLQLDLAGGLALSDAPDDWFVGLGASVRLPR